MAPHRFVPGARLGTYEIVDVIGAGGMGEVYRARDVRLGRQVAIKVLLPTVAGRVEMAHGGRFADRSSGRIDRLTPDEAESVGIRRKP